MRQHVFAMFAGLVLALTAVAFSQADTTPSPAPTTTVHIVNFSFTPADLTVHAGDTVVFQNDDQVIHNVSSDSFQSGDIEGGKSWKHTFDKAGTFTYVCTYHASMKGTITVSGT